MKKESKKHIPNPNGRPIKNTIEPINDSPENVLKTIMMSKSKKKWDYLKNGENCI